MNTLNKVLGENEKGVFYFYLENKGTSLVAQWVRIALPVQGTRGQPLAWEDPTCLGAAEPTCRSFWGLLAIAREAWR